MLPYSRTGLFSYLFTDKSGAEAPIQRMDIRLGQVDPSLLDTVFSTKIMGIPLAMAALFLLGFIGAYRYYPKKI